MAADRAPRARALSRSATRSGKALLGRFRSASDAGPDATRVLTVGRGADELRALWGDPERLQYVLAEPYTGHPSVWTVEQVDVVGDGDGQEVRFRARSGQAEPLTATGAVSFAAAPNGLGTEVTLALRLTGPDLAAGATAHKALRRAKALAETGEIPTLAHNSSARHAPAHKEV